MGKKLAEARGQFVADAAKRGEFFFVGTTGVARIPDAPVDALRARKNGAFFRGGIANGDDRVEALAIELGDGLGAVRGDVDADFPHGLDSERADVAVGLAAGAVHFESAAAKTPQKPFRHLAAHAIAGA